MSVDGLGVVLAQTQAQVPDQYDVTPGLLGFLVTFAIAIAFLVLIRSFNKNMRKVQLNERRRQEAARVAAEAAEAEKADAQEADGEAADAEVSDAASASDPAPTVPAPTEPTETELDTDQADARR
ncbi:hypothetical protein C8046_16530 [Serinibacter arcticus]|uniref:Uncharacterized protein n=1 Tax=Serinibacter arcticus TaxID=1655435 RepID=A0A2U1ZYD6_9MICO|nr:hypothetical protein [Serinibacter arcticus]PWD52008.1 hypothetical protein C8046_16530 [Serinibacter arcticus]